MRKKLIVATCLVALLFSFFIFTNQNADLTDIINQELSNQPSAAGNRHFKLLDATKFTDAMYPWLGIPITVLSEKTLLGEGDNSYIAPDEIKVKKVLIRHKGKKRILIDIDSWRILPGSRNAEQYVKWYLQIIKWTREIVPEANVGVFGLPYSPWNAIKLTKENMLEYQQVYEQLKPIIEASDSIYPLFQFFSSEETDLSYLMGVHLYVAKIANKPVFPIVSHKNTVVGSQFNTSVPINVIKKQCNFVRKNADGLVWWSLEKEQWDPQWYEAVAKQCFM